MKKTLVLLLAFTLLLSAHAPASAVHLDSVRTYDGRFTDLNPGAWYYDDTVACYELNLLDGRSGSIFDPYSDIRLCEAIKFAAVLRRTYLGGSDFRPSTPWYSVYVDYALSCGILDEMPADLNAKATRLQFAELISRALPSTEYEAVNLVEDGAIPDAAQNEAVYMLYRAGVLTGGEDGSFRPNDSITRCEAASTLARAAQSERRKRFTLTRYSGTVEVDTAALAAEAFSLTNELRASLGLSALESDPELAESARIRAGELAEKYSHTRPGGGSCFTALDECGAVYTSAGENIAAGFISAGELVDAWAASPGHFANICGDFDRLAVACAVSDDGMIYWVQIFAK